MTQSQLNRRVAGLTGDSLRTVRSLGFGLRALRDPDLESVPRLSLRVDCPFCGRPAAYPTSDASPGAVLAECPACDVDFDFTPEDVYASGRPSHAGSPRPSR